MTSDWSFLPSLISAASGLCGVWLGGRLTWKRESLREAERVGKESSYLAILVVAHLERFANGCWSVACDDGTSEGRPAGRDGEYYMATSEIPTFDPLVLDVNWKVLPSNLMFEILNLPYKNEQLVSHIAGVGEFADPPDYTDYFWARQYGFAELGLEVSELSRQLRLHAGLLIAGVIAGEANRDDSLREKMTKITNERRNYKSRCTVDPLFMNRPEFSRQS